MKRLKTLAGSSGSGAAVLRAVFARSGVFVSLAALAAALIAASVLILVSGLRLPVFFGALAQTVTGFDARRGFFHPRFAGEWIAQSAPPALCGFSVAFAARAGLFNLGAEGQYLAGLTAAQLAALFFPSVPLLHPAAACGAALLSGALWGAAAGWFRAKTGTAGGAAAAVMLNYLALHLSQALTLAVPGTSAGRTPAFPSTALLKSALLESLTGGSRLGYGLVLTLAAAFVFRALTKHAGRGPLPGAAVSTDGAVRVMAVSGAFAGLAGAVAALGFFSHGRVLGAPDGYGFEGIAAALLGGSTTAGTALAGLFFGMMRAARPLMQSRRIPGEITPLVTALIVCFTVLGTGVRALLCRRPGNPPAAHAPGREEAG